MSHDPGGLIRETPERRLYTVPEFLISHAISRARLYREINGGRLIARKLGGRTLIDADSAAAWRAALPTYKPRTGAAPT